MKLLLAVVLLGVVSCAAQTCTTPGPWNPNPTPQSGTSSWFNAVGTKNHPIIQIPSVAVLTTIM